MNRLLRSKALTFTLVMSITAVFVARIHQQQSSQCGPHGSAQAATFQLDLNNLPPGPWADSRGPGAVEVARQMGIAACTQTNTFVGAALYLGLHLRFDEGTALFDRWDPSTPQPPAEVDIDDGRDNDGEVSLFGDNDGDKDDTVECVSFVRSVYRMAIGQEAPATADAVKWWDVYQSQPGFSEITVGQGLPQPGDFIVFGGGAHGLGHIAVIVGVQAPQGQQDGEILTANGNSSFVLSPMTLLPDMTVISGWGDEYVKGYIHMNQSA